MNRLLVIGNSIARADHNVAILRKEEEIIAVYSNKKVRKVSELLVSFDDGSIVSGKQGVINLNHDSYIMVLQKSVGTDVVSIKTIGEYPLNKYSNSKEFLKAFKKVKSESCNELIRVNEYFSFFQKPFEKNGKEYLNAVVFFGGALEQFRIQIEDIKEHFRL